MSGHITIVQGAQYGSEAKGAVVGYLSENANVNICVRTGAVNAGHTVYYRGREYKMQQVPCGWVHPEVQLIIGAGALVHPDILEAECKMVSEATGQDVKQRLKIDYRAGVHREVHTERSAASGRHHAIGATGKGSSEALIDKIRGRGKGYQVFGRTPEAQFYNVINTSLFLNEYYDQGAHILLEGTQGTLLDINLGPYPYTTHKMTSPANWLAEAGLSPNLNISVVMVARTHPIRVAGNSGFLPGETSWPQVAREMNEKLIAKGLAPRVDEAAIVAFENAVRAATARMQMTFDRNQSEGFPVPSGSDGLDQHRWTADQRFKFAVGLSELNKLALSSLSPATLSELGKVFEFTTVTKKLRRVGHLSTTDLRQAGILNRPSYIVLTFMNYEFPDRWGSTGHPLSDDERAYIQGVEVAARCPVEYVTYGPESKNVVRV